jgi:hypothetical protein
MALDKTIVASWRGIAFCALRLRRLRRFSPYHHLRSCLVTRRICCARLL